MTDFLIVSHGLFLKKYVSYIDCVILTIEL